MSSKRSTFPFIGVRERVNVPPAAPSSFSDGISTGSHSISPAFDQSGTYRMPKSSSCLLRPSEKRLPPLFPPLPCAKGNPMKVPVTPSPSSISVLPTITATASTRATGHLQAMEEEHFARPLSCSTPSRTKSWEEKADTKTSTGKIWSNEEERADPSFHWKLTKKQRVLEWVDEQDSLFRLERAQRSVLLGLEYESRYRLLWDYHAASDNYRVEVGSRRRMELAWKEKRYMASVQAYHRWSSLWTQEVHAREQLVEEEQQQWDYLCGCWEVECLHVEAAAITRERVRAEERWEAHETVRQEEMKAGKKRLENEIRRGMRLPASSPLLSQDGNSLSITIHGTTADRNAVVRAFLKSSSEKGEIEDDPALAPVQYSGYYWPSLASPELVEEEFQARQRIRREEVVCRTIWAAEAEKMTHIKYAERKERKDLHKLFYVGWSPYHLSSIICIQRWWRQVVAHPWSFYRRQRYRSLFAARRREQTSDDYKRKIARLEKQRASKTEQHQMVFPSFSSSLPVTSERFRWMTQQMAHEQDRLALFSAATFRYNCMMDLYIFSLQRMYEWLMEDRRRHFMILIDLCLQRFPDVQDRHLLVASENNEEWAMRRRLEKQLTAILQAPHSMPRRLFTRYRLPYVSWRSTRWLPYAESTLQRIHAIAAEEQLSRNEILHSCERNLRSLTVFNRALQDGVQGVGVYEANMLTLYQEEKECRHLLEQEEQEERVEWKVHQLRLSDAWQVVTQCRVSLIEEAERSRERIVNEEALAFQNLEGGTWRWNRLAAARIRVAFLCHHCGKNGWEPEVHATAARHFVSLNSVACVIARFYYRTRSKYAGRKPKSSDSALMSPTQRRKLLATVCNLAEKSEEDRQKGISRERREREEEIKENIKLNGSKGFFFFSRGELAGFSFLMLEDLTLPLTEERNSSAEAKGVAIKANRTHERIKETPEGRIKDEETKTRDDATTPLISAAATGHEMWARHFQLWLEIEANSPREKEYKEVLQRFQKQNETFSDCFEMLLSIMREGRQGIEMAEYLARHRFRNHSCYRMYVSYQLSLQEQEERKGVVREEWTERYEVLLGHGRFINQLIVWEKQVERTICTPSSNLKLPRRLFLQSRPCRHTHHSTEVRNRKVEHKPFDCTLYRRPLHILDNIEEYVHNGPSLESILKGQLFPNTQAAVQVKDKIDAQQEELLDSNKGSKDCPFTCLTAMDRLFSREEITRCRIEVDHHREVGNLFLFTFSLTFRKAIEEEAVEALESCARLVDQQFPANPSVALTCVITVEEAVAREKLEECILIEWYQQPLLFAHRQYLEDCVWMQFMLGHTCMSSAASYMERSLSDLLIQRAHYVDEKIADLLELEHASRIRLEYINDITRMLQWRWNKLVY